MQFELEHEKRFHGTVDHLLEGLQIIDFNWRYVYVNEAVVKQSKFSREQLLGHSMMEIYPGLEQTELFKVMSLSMNARVPHLFENVFTFPDNSTGCFELSIQPTEGGLTILSNDISEKKKAEKEKAERSAALERLIFMTSHNLRQPVTQVQGLANLLKSQVQSLAEANPELKKIVDYLIHSASSLDNVTRDLTSYIQSIELKAKK
ncbi:histidine kinase [Sphingobacteriaceae bacterium]|nr:histidine kinase [Sphingobacteriaceae bacterium]